MNPLYKVVGTPRGHQRCRHRHCSFVSFTPKDEKILAEHERSFAAHHNHFTAAHLERILSHVAAAVTRESAELEQSHSAKLKKKKGRPKKTNAETSSDGHLAGTDAAEDSSAALLSPSPSVLSRTDSASVADCELCVALVVERIWTAETVSRPLPVAAKMSKAPKPERVEEPANLVMCRHKECPAEFSGSNKDKVQTDKKEHENHYESHAEHILEAAGTCKVCLHLGWWSPHSTILDADESKPIQRGKKRPSSPLQDPAAKRVPPVPIDDNRVASDSEEDLELFDSVNNGPDVETWKKTLQSNAAERRVQRLLYMTRPAAPDASTSAPSVADVEMVMAFFRCGLPSQIPPPSEMRERLRTHSDRSRGKTDRIMEDESMPQYEPLAHDDSMDMYGGAVAGAQAAAETSPMRVDSEEPAPEDLGETTVDAPRARSPVEFEVAEAPALDRSSPTGVEDAPEPDLMEITEVNPPPKPVAAAAVSSRPMAPQNGQTKATAFVLDPEDDEASVAGSDDSVEFVAVVAQKVSQPVVLVRDPQTGKLVRKPVRA